MCCAQVFDIKDELEAHKKTTRKVVATSLTKRISNHLSLFIVILILLFFSFPSTVLADSYTSVTVLEAKIMIDSNPSLVILDVRNQSEYDSGHIRNAKLIPVFELEGRLSELNKSDEILVYCKLGGRSSTASQILVDNDFLYVYNMLGGITAWMDEGYQVYVKYSLIQEAINNASEGDTIFVSSGTYHEHVVVNKTVNLVGEDVETTVICGNGTQVVMKIVNPNVNITSFTIRNGAEGVYLLDSADSCVVINSKMMNNSVGVFVKTDNNVFTGNIIVNNNGAGIKIYASCSCSPVRRNIVRNNILLGNSLGAELTNSVESQVYHNNFINNTHQTVCNSDNIWDNDYPSGGNYWSDYNGTDIYNGPYQAVAGGDGIGDTPYTVSASIADNFPLMAPISKFEAYTENDASYSVDIVSNSTVSAFSFNPNEGAFLGFNVIGDDGTTSFCRVTIPKELLWVENDWTVMVGDEQVGYMLASDEANNYLYFMYHHSIRVVKIIGTHVIPEFPIATTLFLAMILIAFLIAITKKTWN